MKTWLSTCAGVLLATTLHADPLTCNMSGYKAAPGLAAATTADALTVTWNGDSGQEVRMTFGLEAGAPIIRDLAVRKTGGAWASVASNVKPEFKVVTARRRASYQQIEPLEKELKVPITNEVIDKIKWDAFWDAPLYIEGSGKRPPTHADAIPPMEGVANQPGLPRKPEEVQRANAAFAVKGCEVKTSGARLEIAFPGVTLGLFSGRLQFDVFAGTNMVRQVLIAKTDQDNVAYKYDAGLGGLPVAATNRVVWRDLAGRWQDQQFGGIVNRDNAVVWSANRLIAAELPAGAIAAFPPPHSFYGARESNQILGDNYYRKDSAASFAFGIRQAEKEEDPEFLHNFALTSARPGTWQHMPVFLYVTAGKASTAVDGALAFTRGDFFKPLAGYQVMGSHYHVGVVPRLKESGSLDNRLNDVDSLKAVGINIFGVIDGVRSPDKGEAYLKAQAEYYDAARRQSDKTFLLMPNKENVGVSLGGHHDLMVSKPTFWIPERKAGEPLVTEHPTYGKVYHLGSPADLFELTKAENAIINMPHPRTKGSTGYPEGMKDTHFAQPTYEGAGFRWGMGVDGSERRLCEYRCLNLFDEMSNWYVDRDMPLKHMQGISESRSDIGDRGKPPSDGTYANGPVNYVHIPTVPSVDDMSSLINAMKKGDYFVTSGEVLITNYAVTGTGAQRTITADLEWTYPLDFMEIVWGDGQKTDRQIISATDLAPFGKKHISIPFDATGKKWVRFAAWDVATNGAFVQPIRLNGK